MDRKKRMELVLEHAYAILDPDKVACFMNKPRDEFDGLAPTKLLDSDEGMKKVWNFLDKKREEIFQAMIEA